MSSILFYRTALAQIVTNPINKCLLPISIFQVTVVMTFHVYTFCMHKCTLALDSNGPDSEPLTFPTSSAPHTVFSG